MMDALWTFVSAGLTPLAFWAAIAITAFAGFVKGNVGFAMPLIMMSAFSSFLPPETALAGLILPTLFTNLGQCLRDGVGAAVASARKYWRFLAATMVMIVVSAPFVRDIPKPMFLLLLGVPITAYALIQLSGRPLIIPVARERRMEWVLGTIGGLYGGVSGIWGPPLIVYLLSRATPRVEMLRVQGVVFMLGSVVLLGAHLRSGVVGPVTWPFSAVLVLPALAGLMLGFRLGDLMDQNRFRWWTQALLVVSGLNLIRQALTL